MSCPSDTNGSYPDCECQEGGFSKSKFECLSCPENSTSLYPNCQCEQNDHKFSSYIDECYIPCPEDSQGVHPYCRCYDGYYDENEFNCKSFLGRKCTHESIGIGPDCLCMRRKFVFDVHSWSCSIGFAPSESPISGCPNGEKYPDCPNAVDINVVKSLLG